MCTSNVSFPQIAKAYDVLKEKGVTAELFQERLLETGLFSDIAEAIVMGNIPDRDLVRKSLGLPPKELWITVNYDLSLAEMIKAGEYDWTNSDITDKRFPVKGKGTSEVVCEMIHFGKDTTTEEVEKELDKRRLRPAKIEELLAFGVAFPEIQRKFPVVALGSVARVGGRRYVAYLSRSGSERDLYLGWADRGWDGYFRFLALRK